MDLLVVGANGLLGSNVVAEALNRDRFVVGTYRTTEPAFDVPLFNLDVRDEDTVAERIKSVGPDTVVNCAAMTDVDECERRPDQAHEVNAIAPGYLARTCNDLDVRFVHVSTDYVFDGDSSSCYHEESTPNPIQEYGQSKLVGERNVLAAHDSALVLRLSFGYGVHRGGESPVLDGFPAWVRSQLESGGELTLFTDQHVSPSRAGSVASALLDLLDRGDSGIYHVASRSCVTPYEFGLQLVQKMGASKSSFQADSQADDSRDAARPPHTCLDVAKVETTLNRPQPTVAADLDSLAEYL
jgi:dTDP-4-dehydrorhamnose reductase